MELKFRKLKENEIDVRIGQVSKTKPKANLLLYKDARVDMQILDETVGAMNWKREHLRDNANCTVSIYDSDKKEWVSKEDTGTESNTEAEKGLASDSFKRACVNWGIGRELYTAPQIWVDYDKEKDKYSKFTVLKIGYDESGNINELIIAKDGKPVYSLKKANEKNIAPMPERNEKKEAFKRITKAELVTVWEVKNVEEMIAWLEGKLKTPFDKWTEEQTQDVRVLLEVQREKKRAKKRIEETEGDLPFPLEGGYAERADS